jgi:hypothetical protein
MPCPSRHLSHVPHYASFSKPFCGCTLHAEVVGLLSPEGFHLNVEEYAGMNIRQPMCSLHYNSIVKMLSLQLCKGACSEGIGHLVFVHT